MDVHEHYNQVLNIIAKSKKILALKSKLELRRKDLLGELTFRNNLGDVIKMLKSVARIYKGEIKIIKLSRQGIIEAIEILESNYERSLRELGLGGWIKSSLHNIWRILRNREKKPYSIIVPFKQLRSEILKQFKLIFGSLDDIEDLLNKQREIVNELYYGLESGAIDNKSKKRYLTDIKELSGKELEVIKSTVKRSNKKRILEIMATMNNILSKYRYLAAAQGVFAMAPITTSVSVWGGLNYGALIGSLIYSIGWAIETSPTWIAISIEMSRRKLK